MGNRKNDDVRLVYVKLQGGVKGSVVGIPSWVGLQARGDIGESGQIVRRVGGWENCRGEASAYSERSEPSGGARQRTPHRGSTEPSECYKKKLKRRNDVKIYIQPPQHPQGSVSLITFVISFSKCLNLEGMRETVQGPLIISSLGYQETLPPLMSLIGKVSSSTLMIQTDEHNAYAFGSNFSILISIISPINLIH